MNKVAKNYYHYYYYISIIYDCQKYLLHTYLLPLHYHLHLLVVLQVRACCPTSHKLLNLFIMLLRHIFLHEISFLSSKKRSALHYFFVNFFRKNYSFSLKLAGIDVPFICSKYVLRYTCVIVVDMLR